MQLGSIFKITGLGPTIKGAAVYSLRLIEKSLNPFSAFFYPPTSLFKGSSDYTDNAECFLDKLFNKLLQHLHALQSKIERRSSVTCGFKGSSPNNNDYKIKSPFLRNSCVPVIPLNDTLTHSIQGIPVCVLDWRTLSYCVCSRLTEMTHAKKPKQPKWCKKRDN